MPAGASRARVDQRDLVSRRDVHVARVETEQHAACGVELLESREDAVEQEVSACAVDVARKLVGELVVAHLGSLLDVLG